MDRVTEAFEHYLQASTWFEETHGKDPNLRIAYFSAEFGIHESVPVYSGGLGILAGDHSSRRAIWACLCVGVGLMYREGYFRQYLNIDGWQQERYPENDFFNLPLIAETKPDGSPLLMVSADCRGARCRTSLADSGRPSAAIPARHQHPAEQRPTIATSPPGSTAAITHAHRTGNGAGHRRHSCSSSLGQEADPSCHMNEGHSAFCGLERIRMLMEESGSTSRPLAKPSKAGTCFTTHTPVPAGNDAFPSQMMASIFRRYMPALKIDRGTFLGLGREQPQNEQRKFLHDRAGHSPVEHQQRRQQTARRVSRKMWKDIWPGLPEAEMPITSITNGVHTQTWMSPEIGQLYDRYLGVQWEEQPTNFDIWQRVDHIPDAELWRTHERRREAPRGLRAATTQAATATPGRSAIGNRPRR